MGGKGSKSWKPREEGAANKEEPATAEPKEAGNEAASSPAPGKTSSTSELQEGNQVGLCESGGEDMEKDYVEAVVAKASEFGENE